MAKSVPKKKVNRKMKRSVRRIVSAVLMITAIAIAAIPVPENIASNGAVPTATLPVVDISYPGDNGTSSKLPNMTLDNKINNVSIPLSIPGGATEKESLTVRQMSDGKWQINWQFKFYDAPGTDKRVVISQYNSEYKADEVTLKANINMEYEIVSEQKYDAYYNTDVATTKYTLDYDTWANGTMRPPIVEFFKKYVPGAYETFVEACEKYKKDKAEWDVMDPADQIGKVEPTKPNDVVKPISELTDEQKLQYYCDDTETDTVNHNKGGYPGATLVEVYDQRASSQTPGLVYMPKGATNADKIDENGFWYNRNAIASVIAIGDNAFKGTQNVNILNLPSEIKFIGDEAFFESFIQEVSFESVENIGNRAFQNCTRLHKVTFQQGLVDIGTEAFKTTALTEVVFPASAKRIGAGAFAKCTDLKVIDLQNIGKPEAEIGDYAFYNTTALDSVVFGNSKIHQIGEAAFALESGQTGKLDTFEFPRTIAKSTEFGDKILAGRAMMKKVVMPADYGRSLPVVEIPENTFYGCINLETVEFPADGNGSSGLVTYDEKMFLSVINPKFYIRGPELDNAGQTATPRKATWVAKTAVLEYVPYVYTKNGIDYYEISKDNYLLAGNANGELTSCTLKDPTITTPLDLIIPSEVGGYNIKTLAPGCIGDDVKKYLRTLTIEDNSLSAISDNVFANSEKLEKVLIGNSVNAIGNSAFENCKELVDVTFNTPLNGYEGFAIGAKAFETGSDELTFRGDIVAGYAPFEWAMAKDNLIDELTGKRVCYKSIEPTRMTVMRDNETGEVTLLDYPKLANIDRDNVEYCKTMEDFYKAKYPQNPSVSGNVSGNTPCSGPDDEQNHGPWCADYKYSILENYERGENVTKEWQTISPREQTMIDATRDIVIPAGITSIDVVGFLKSNKNNVNIVTYLTKSGFNYPLDMYRDTKTETVNGETKEVTPGLFSGHFEDFAGILPDEAAKFETEKRGNDAVRSIKLSTVKYLPDYAFDDCEQLESVDLGACENIGTAPFRGCDNLTSVGGNDKYTCENGIIYSVDTDGSLKIEECLPARGKLVGSPIVDITNDPKIAEVGHIADGAFEDCDYLVRVYLENSPKLKTIPKYCFRNADKLTEVILPASVNEVQEKAFENNNPLFVTFYGKEVSIRDDAFEHDPGVEIRSYKDSAAITYAKTYGLTPTIIEEGFKVDFLDYDGTFLAKTQFVQKDGAAVVPDDPKREGHTFTGWSCTVPNMSVKKITGDASFIAQYKSNTTGGDGGNTGNNGGNNGSNGGNNGSNGSTSGNGTSKDIFTVTVVNGSGSGTYAKGTTVTITANAPATGKKFDRWETSSMNVSMANVTKTTTTFKMPANNVVVTAVYDSSSSSGGGSSSGSNTNRPGSSTSGNTGSSGSGGVGSGSTLGTGTTVTITKPGISNVDKAAATVDGSSDNFIVRISETAEATAAVERALTKEFGSLENIRYFPMDISLYDSTGTTKIADTTGLTVNITIPIPDDLITYAGNNKAGAVLLDDNLEKLNATFKTIDGIPCISFKATHFSPYTVYVDTQNLTAGMDSSPKTGDGLHPKWFLAIGLACLSVVLFMKRDKKNLTIA